MRRSHGWWLAAVIVMSPGLSGAQESNPAKPDTTATSATHLLPVVDNTRKLVRRVLASADHHQRPFAVVDKHAATIAVYRADGALAGTSAALLGSTLGDHTVPGVGERAQTGRLRPGDRTTPAGRFNSEPGRNRDGDRVVWIDYASAFAIHRLRAGPSKTQRARRLGSASSADKRVSDGCVVVPEAFFDAVVGPTLGSGRGVVYVLPERVAWQDLLQGL